MMMKSEQKKIIEFFRAEDGFTILPHINPDGDAFGSGSALFLVLKALRKRVQFVVREQIPFMYRTMPLASTFQTHLGLNARRLYRKTAVLSSSITIFPIKGLGICNGSNPKPRQRPKLCIRLQKGCMYRSREIWLLV